MFDSREFPLTHKYGYSEYADLDGTKTQFHYQVINPHQFANGCTAIVVGGRENSDGSYDMDVKIT